MKRYFRAGESASRRKLLFPGEVTLDSKAGHLCLLGLLWSQSRETESQIEREKDSENEEMWIGDKETTVLIYELPITRETCHGSW